MKEKEKKDKILIDVTVESLQPSEREGFLTKCGGSVQSWKKRWFILKGPNLYYFKNKKDKKATGVIAFTRESYVLKEPTKKNKLILALKALDRIFLCLSRYE